MDGGVFQYIPPELSKKEILSDGWIFPLATIEEVGGMNYYE